MVNRTVLLGGVAMRRVDQLRAGDRVDLEADVIADPDAYAGGNSQHSEFEFEFEVVLEMECETDECTRVDFESGFSCGFPPDHLVHVDGEQGES